MDQRVYAKLEYKAVIDMATDRINKKNLFNQIFRDQIDQTVKTKLDQHEIQSTFLKQQQKFLKEQIANDIKKLRDQIDQQFKQNDYDVKHSKNLVVTKSTLTCESYITFLQNIQVMDKMQHKMEEDIYKIKNQLDFFLVLNQPDCSRIKQKFKDMFGEETRQLYYPTQDKYLQSEIILQRYNVQIESKHLQEYLEGQKLTSSTIEFVSGYFMEKQQQNWQPSNEQKPNLIIPQRIFVTGDEDFTTKQYITQIRKKQHIPAIQSIFEGFGLIGIPININNQHWVAIVVETEKKIIHIFDSNKDVSEYQIEIEKNVQFLKRVIDKVHQGTSKKYEMSAKLKSYQENEYDCGVFVLKFFQTMMFQGLQKESLPFVQKEVTEFRRNLYYLIPMLCINAKGHDYDDDLDMKQNSEFSKIEDGSLFTIQA